MGGTPHFRRRLRRPRRRHLRLGGPPWGVMIQ